MDVYVVEVSDLLGARVIDTRTGAQVYSSHDRHVVYAEADRLNWTIVTPAGKIDLREQETPVSSFNLISFATDGRMAEPEVIRFDGTLDEAKTVVDRSIVEDGEKWSAWEERHGTWGRSGPHYGWQVEVR